MEHKLSPNWSLKAEYQYIDLGQTKLAAGVNDDGDTTDATYKVDDTYHTVRVGLNYQFGNTYEPSGE